ncbi:MAG: hypothetical protein ACE5E6_02745 [Phycisphaerae bacterium]
MIPRFKTRGSRIAAAGALVLAASVFQLPSCAQVLTVFDPCGTILGSCAPGALQLLFADVPDFDVDPTCTIPGGCTNQTLPSDIPFVSPFSQVGGQP